MLLFVAHEPTVENEKDGMAQRVKWIDNQFCDSRRVILSLSLKRNLRCQRLIRSETLVVEKMNVFLHFFKIIYLIMKSDVTYVHSCYNAVCILPMYFLGRRIITDMHGVVPEEETLIGNFWRAKLLSFVERVVIKRSTDLVFVTKAMQAHFEAKYSFSEAATYIIPIFSENETVATVIQRASDLVIYAGGLQAWQRVDRMLEVAKRLDGNFRFLFLTGTPDLLRSDVEKLGLERAQVGSVPRTKIFDYYREASYGFLLRDDSVVNRVACPTKLVEYLWTGVIPIVEHPFIGDFFDLGYRYILVSAFLEGTSPNPAVLEVWREQNRQVASSLESQTRNEFSRLKQMCFQRQNAGVLPNGEIG